MTASEILREVHCPEPGDHENLPRVAALRARAAGLDLWDLPGDGLEQMLAELRGMLGRYKHASDSWAEFDRTVAWWKDKLRGLTRPPTRGERRDRRKRRGG